MPDWSPVRTFGGYAAWGEAQPRPSAVASNRSCAVHGHHAAAAVRAQLPTADPQSLWGALGCACWAF
jgi:hypothetical protein